MLKKVFTILALPLFIFFLSGSIGAAKLKVPNVQINENKSTSIYILNLLGEEHSSLALLKSKKTSLYYKALKWAADVDPHHLNSMFGLVLPGVTSYDSVFMHAGYEDIPVESAPPVEVFLKEREMAAKELAELNKDFEKGPNFSPEEKKLYIYHTHSWESYFPLIGMNNEINENKSVDGKTNITILGDLLGKEMEKRGIGTVVNRTNVGKELNKLGWNTNQSYNFSRKLVQSAMTTDKNLKYFIDLHRDSLRKKSTTITIEDKPFAKLVFVIGKDNKNYVRNIELATGIHNYLQTNYPGLSKGIMGKSGLHVDGVYNQDLSPNSLVIEIGGVDNNMKELKNSIEALAEALAHEFRKKEEI